MDKFDTEKTLNKVERRVTEGKKIFAVCVYRRQKIKSIKNSNLSISKLTDIRRF